MATIYRELPVAGAIFRTTAAPAISFRAGTGGSNAVPIRALNFDASSAEKCYWAFRPFGIGSGNTVDVTLHWFAETATSGSVVWGVRGYSATPDTDSGDIEAVNLGTQSSVTDTHLGTTGQRPHQVTISAVDMGSPDPGDTCFLVLERIAGDASDTMTGDACVYMVSVSYSDT